MATWRLRTRTLNLDAGPLVMGIVNTTPDSFSDGGKYSTVESAVAHGRKLASAGADILDIGGESTRPYSQPVDEQEELERTVPVIEQLAAEIDCPLSIDTSKAAVARACISAGAEIINDVTGLEGDPLMLQTAVETEAGICAMHMQGTPQTMQDNPTYVNVVEEIFGYLAARRAQLVEAGVEPERICLDPGIGFGKTHEHNLTLLHQCRRFLELNQPILVGHSRKGFIAKLLGDKQVERDSGTLAVTLYLARQGMHVVRVHEVARTVRALRVQRALELQRDN